MRLVLLCMTLLVTLSVAREGRADESTPATTERSTSPPDGENRVRRTARTAESEADPELDYDDYRLTMVAVDATAVALVAAGVYLDHEDVTPALALVGVGTYVLGGPIIHLAHEQSGRALGSIGLRVGLPATGLLVGGALAASCGGASEWCLVGAVLFGGVIGLGGVLAAIIVDDAVLGRAPKPATKSAARVALTPLLDPKRRAAGLSLVGAF
jgi:hypothetical protein